MFSGFQQTYNAFVQSGIENPLEETLTLLNILTNGALRQMVDAVWQGEQVDLAQILEKRQQGMPWEYILGQTHFMGLTLSCSQAALIPRQETELLVKTVQAALAKLEQDSAILIDMGTGSGNIAVSAAFHAPNVRVLASDVSEEAVALARQNAARYHLQDRVSFFCGDLFTPLQNLGYEGAVDIVVCNPPYIPTASLDNLAPEIIDYEPVVALDAGPYGINIYRRLVSDALLFLKPGGLLAFEIGAGQEKIAERLLQKTGAYETISFVRDENGVIRVITAVSRPQLP